MSKLSFFFSFLFYVYALLLCSSLHLSFCRSFSKGRSFSTFSPDSASPSQALLERDVERKFPNIPFPKEEIDSYLDWEEQKGKTNKLLSRASHSSGQKANLAISGRDLLREELREKGRNIVRITLKGNVKLYHNQIRIKAQSIKIEDQKIGEIKGTIEIYDPQTKIYAYAQNAKYNRDQERIYLWGKVYVKKEFSKDEKLLLSCKGLDYHLKKKNLLLEGSVRAHYADSNMLAESGKYLASQKKLVLETNPVLWSPRAYLVGKTLSFAEEKRSFEFKGESLLYLYTSISLRPSYATIPRSSRLEEDKKKTLEELPTILTADRVVYFHSGSVEAEGKALLTQTGMSFRANYLHFSGKKQGQVSAHGNVHALDYKENTEMRAQKLEYKEEAQKLLLEEKAFLSFYEDSSLYKGNKGRTLTRLSGEYIERDFSKKVVRAQGGVRISQKNYKGEAELLNYKEDSQTLIMEGNAGVYRKRTFIRAEKIFVYSRGERILFQKRVGASLKQ